VTAHCT